MEIGMCRRRSKEWHHNLKHEMDECFLSPEAQQSSWLQFPEPPSSFWRLLAVEGLQCCTNLGRRWFPHVISVATCKVAILPASKGAIGDW